MAIFLIITSSMLVVSYSQFKDERDLQYLRKEKELLEITTQLSDQLSSYDQILKEYGAENLDTENKVYILNKVLQPVVFELVKKYPNTGLGYYSKELDRHIALGPQFDPSFLTRGASSTDIEPIYHTRMYRSLKIEKPILWDGKPIFTVQLPIIRNGEIIGHAFANTTISNLDNLILQGTIKRGLHLVLIWSLVLILLLYVFRSLHQKDKEQLETILNNASDSFYALDKDMVITYCNKGAIKHFGCNPIGKIIWDAIPQSRAPHFVDMFSLARSKRKAMYFEFISLVSSRWVGLNIYPTDNGGLSVFFRDIHEIKQVNEQIKQRFLKAFNLNPNLMVLTSIDGEPTYLDVNDAYLKTIGLEREEIVGQPISEINLFSDLKQYDEIRKLLSEQGYISNYELDFRHCDAIRTGLLSSEKFEIDGKACILTVITDITEKKQLDKELARFDSLNLVGEIAASIGHEVRNPMTTVRGYLQMFLAKSEFGSHKERIETMIEELDRANSIITEFLSLAKNKTTEMKIGNLNNVVNVLFPLIQADAFRLGHSVLIESNPIPDTLFDEKEMRQLILNIIRNAFEAMSQSGIVKIKTYVSESDVILEISDTGNGIPMEILDKIGNPFLTTKESGTGLGLSVCYRIAQRHKAKITLQTNSCGTTFFINFASLV